MPLTTRSFILTILGALALLTGQSAADTFVVDRFDDSTVGDCLPTVPGDCALRGAVIRANSSPGDDVILLPAGTYTLSIPGAWDDACLTGDLDVTDTLLIVGEGAELTVVDGGGLDRVFDVHPSCGRLTLRGVTVAGGLSVAGTSGGAGIRAIDSSLRLESCVVSGNEMTVAHAGTAVYAYSTVPGDMAEIVDSWITGNTGHGQTLSLGPGRLERTTVSGNTHLGSQGVVVALHGTGGALLDSTIGDNTRPASGPAVLIGAPGYEVRGSTLVDDPGRMVLLVATGGSAALGNTVVVGLCVQGGGPLTTLGGNLESPGNSCGLGGSDLVNVANPGLSALGFAGGPAPLYRPLPGGPALDAPLAAAGCRPLDQRGLSRPRDGDGDGAAVCDIGAAELAGPGELFLETFECGFATGWSQVVR